MSLTFRTLAFYVISTVEQPQRMVEEHSAFLAERGMVGRVYCCADGVNAQVSGDVHACDEYMQLLVSSFPTQQLLFKLDPVAEVAFPKLRVKLKALVPSLQGERLNLADRGVDLSPVAWDEMMAEPSHKLLLDVRNGYEWDVGRFAGAERPRAAQFSDSDAALYGLPQDEQERAETPVMMYCTGGIRCEYFSAKLKQSGFKKVYKLQGGVQHYGNEFANTKKHAEAASMEEGGNGGSAGGGAAPHWKGSLFVFDRRNVMPMGSDEVVGRCAHCGAPTEIFLNCGNIDCNKLHLVCSKCLPRTQGYCCESCSTAPRRRPLPVSDATGAEGALLSAESIAALTQGPRPGALDPNKLSSIKPANVPRKAFDADTHGFRGRGDGSIVNGEEEVA